MRDLGLVSEFSFWGLTNHAPRFTLDVSRSPIYEPRITIPKTYHPHLGLSPQGGKDVTPLPLWVMSAHRLGGAGFLSAVVREQHCAARFVEVADRW